MQSSIHNEFLKGLLLRCSEEQKGEVIPVKADVVVIEVNCAMFSNYEANCFGKLMKPP